MKTKRTRWFDKGKDAHWRGVMKEFAKSGLSVREFCRRHQIGEPLFYSWRRTLSERDRQSAAGVDQHHSRVDSSPGAIGLAPVAVVSATTEDWAPAMEIVLADNLRVRIDGKCPASLLESVMSMLGSAIQSRGEPRC